MGLYAELRRRNVFRVAAAYIVMGWLLLQVADVAFGFIEAPEWIPKAMLTLLVIGFPPVIAIAWLFEFTPQGLKRDGDVESGGDNQVAARRLDYLTIGAVLVLAGWTFYEQVRPPAADPLATSERASATVPSAPGSDAGTAAVDQEPATVRQRPAPPPLELDPLAVAVLPFANRSTGDDTAYFVDGIHDDLLTQLARIGELRVISRTSVLEYRGTTKNMKQIGEELGARNILEGAVQRAGDRVRINAQLIDANTDKHLWADTFDRELTADNLFDIQSDIARSIARALASTLGDGGAESLALGDAPTRSQAAYDLYLRARAIGETMSSEAPRERIVLLEQAVEIDPDFALAVAEIGHQYTNLYWYGTRDPAHEAEGHRWLDRARAMAPDDPQIQWYWADHLYHGHLDYDGALDALAVAQDRLPNSSDLFRMRGWIQRRAGRFEASIDAFLKVVQLDPRDSETFFDLSITYGGIGDLANYSLWRDRMLALGTDDVTMVAAASIEANLSGDLSMLMEATSSGPGNGNADHYIRFLAPYLARDFEAARAVIDRWPDGIVTDQHYVSVKSLARALIARATDGEGAAAELTSRALPELKAFATAYPEDPRGRSALALAHGLLGETDSALDLANEAVALYPMARDAFSHRQYLQQRVVVMAFILPSIQVAQAIEDLLETPGYPVGFRGLIKDPAFDRHRDHPAFELLAAKYARTGTT